MTVPRKDSIPAQKAPVHSEDIPAGPRGVENTPLPAPAQSADPSSPKLPAVFGRYRLQKVLGQGGMGIVYLAYDPQLERPVALKAPRITAADGSQVVARFYREAKAAATVRHPNICPVYDVGEVDGGPYLTMAYIEGKPLSEVVRLNGLTPRQSAGLVRKLALAVQEAHRHGVIHRDLKPSNVMIDRRGVPIIMDFGLARRTRSGEARLTRSGAIVGTPAYMPPEQAGGESEANGPAGDVYSLGVILYELLTGRLPFRGDALRVLMQIVQDEPPPPSSLRKDLDPAIEAICLKAMAKKVEARYASAAALAGTLGDYLRAPAAESPAGAPTTPQAGRADDDQTGPPAAPFGRPVRPNRRTFAPSVALGALLVAVPIIGWLTYHVLGGALSRRSRIGIRFPARGMRRRRPP